MTMMVMMMITTYPFRPDPYQWSLEQLSFDIAMTSHGRLNDDDDVVNHLYLFSLKR